MRRLHQTAWALLLGAAAVILLLFIPSCGRNYATPEKNPSLTFQRLMECVSQGDLAAVMEMTGTAVEVSPSEFRGSVEEKLILAVFSRTKVLAEPTFHVDGKDAWADVVFYHPDAGLVMAQAIAGAIDETGEYEWRHGSYKTDGQISEAIERALLHQLDGDLSNSMITEKIRVRFRYTDDNWALLMSDELFEVLTGNLSGADEKVDAFFKEYKAGKSG